MTKFKKDFKGKNHELFEYAKKYYPEMSNQDLDFHYKNYNNYRYPLKEFSKKLKDNPHLFVIYLNLKLKPNSPIVKAIVSVILWFKERKAGL